MAKDKKSKQTDVEIHHHYEDTALVRETVVRSEAIPDDMTLRATCLVNAINSFGAGGALFLERRYGDDEAKAGAALVIERAETFRKYIESAEVPEIPPKVSVTIPADGV